jgi:hypothetical protein
MAMAYDYTRKGMPTVQLEAQLAHLRVRRAELAAQRASAPSDIAIMCAQIGCQGDIDRVEIEISARTTGLATFTW